MSIGRSGTSPSVTTLGAALYSEGTAPMKRLYVVAFALVLAGCGGDPPPAAPSPPSPSASSTSLAAPVMPERAKEDSREGAVAFVRHYVRLINFAQATGDSTGLRAASWKSCQACSRVSDAIDRLYKAGGHIEGGRWNLRKSFATREMHSRSWLVVASISYSKQLVIEPGKETRELKGGKHSFRFQVKPQEQTKVLSWLRVD